jgi:hypothetical protein
MFAGISEKVLKFLTAVWRVFGSPRIFGDERAVSGVKAAWAERGRASEAGSSLNQRGRYVIFAVSGLVALVILIWVMFSIFGGEDGDAGPDGSTAVATPTAFTGPEYLTEVESLEVALTAARNNGLISTDFSHISRRIQFGEYAQAIGEFDRAERGLLETPLDTEIWAVGFAGDVELELDSGEVVKYDNLTVVLDALTGRVFRVEAFYGEYESEARAPEWLRPPTATPVRIATPERR